MVIPGGVEIVKVMINWIVTNFGEYTPNVDPNTGEYLQGLASINFTWLVSVGLFALLLLYVLRIILAFFKGVDW